MMARNYKMIFVGGIHGVGKSTAARVIANEVGADVVTASELIREARRGVETWDAQKRVSAIQANQDLLVKAVAERVWQKPIAILEGHFTLQDSAGNVECIPISVFQELRPTLLVVLIDHPYEIATRLRARDGTDHSVAKLREMQELEVRHAETVGKSLGIDVVISRVEEVAAVTARVGTFSDR